MISFRPFFQLAGGIVVCLVTWVLVQKKAFVRDVFDFIFDPAIMLCVAGENSEDAGSFWASSTSFRKKVIKSSSAKSTTKTRGRFPLTFCHLRHDSVFLVNFLNSVFHANESPPPSASTWALISILVFSVTPFSACRLCRLHSVLSRLLRISARKREMSTSSEFIISATRHPEKNCWSVFLKTSPAASYLSLPPINSPLPPPPILLPSRHDQSTMWLWRKPSALYLPFPAHWSRAWLGSAPNYNSLLYSFLLSFISPSLLASFLKTRGNLWSQCFRILFVTESYTTLRPLLHPLPSPLYVLLSPSVSIKAKSITEKDACLQLIVKSLSAGS